MSDRQPPDAPARTRLRSRTGALAALLCLAAWPALADPLPPGLDANHDGRVSRDEFVIFSRQRNLARADTNHDGRISKAEARAAMGAAGMMLDLYWGKVDTDNDGYLSVAEMDRMSIDRFRKLDVNHDGVLDTAEQAALQKRR